MPTKAEPFGDAPSEPWRPGLAFLRNVALLLFSIGLVLVTHLVATGPSISATALVMMMATATAMHARLAVGAWWSIAAIAGCAALLAVAGGTPPGVATVLATSLAAAELAARRTARAAILQSGAWAALIAGGVSLAMVAAMDRLLADVIARETIGAVVGALLGPPVMLAAGPLVEKIFGHITRLTMSEWLNYDHPLLRELSAAAPGTFQHSVNVAVLADAAARAIGADALLARVGALYHDVGKLRAPEYFIENQRDRNPHDDLSPRESARILRAHVTDGVDLVNAHGLGDRVAQFVREHHGTAPMRGFQEKAGVVDGSSDSQGETYRYEGPRPGSRETGIVMIADQLEATARSAPPPDESHCRELVSRTIQRIVEEGQLDDARLGQAQLARLETAFVRSLLAMYHRRVPYPERRDRPVERWPAAHRLLSGRGTRS